MKKVTLTTNQLNWLIKVVNKRINTPEAYVKTVPELLKIKEQLDAIKGLELTLTRKQLRLVQDICLSHLLFVSGTVVDELNKRSKKEGNESAKNLVSFYSVLRGELEKLNKTLQGAL